MSRIHHGRPRSCGGLADHLSAPELVTRQVDLDPGREPVPHMRFDPLAVEIHVGRQKFPAQEVVDDQGGDVALTAARILRRPIVFLVGGVEAPGLANGLFQLRERERQG